MYLQSFICTRCGKPYTAITEEALNEEFPTCPHCKTPRSFAPMLRAEARRERDNIDDVVNAFRACMKFAGLKTAVEILLEWAAADNRSRIMVDLWDAAVPMTEPPTGGNTPCSDDYHGQTNRATYTPKCQTGFMMQ